MDGFLRSLGLGRGSERSEEDKAVDTFAEHLSVFPLDKSSVVAVDYTSGDSGLAAQIANKLADVYIAWQREAALEQTKDATAWLNAQIEVLRPKVAEAEAAVEQFKASGLSGTEIKLRALEGEAKAERDLLESYLARYRDASARHDMGAVPAQAAIVSRAHASILPSFPKPGPISLLVAVATALLSLAYVLPRATDRLTGSAAPGDPGKRPPPARAPARTGRARGRAFCRGRGPQQTSHIANARGRGPGRGSLPTWPCRACRRDGKRSSAHRCRSHGGRASDMEAVADGSTSSARVAHRLASFLPFLASAS